MSLALLGCLFLFFVPLFLLLSSNTRNATSKKSPPPPSPPKLPMIGNLHQLGFPPHRSFRTLSEKYGPLMLLYLGQVTTLVVSSPQMAREIMRTHDLVFASRPSLKAIRVLLHGGNDVVFEPYGDYWKQARRLFVTHLRSAKMVQASQKAREEEVALMSTKISHATSSVGSVDMSDILLSFSNNVTCKIVSRKFLREERKKQLLRVLEEELSRVVEEFNPSDVFPSFEWLDGIFAAKQNARMKRNADKWDGVLEEVIKNHAHQLKDDGAQNNSADFMDVLLLLQKESNGEFLTKQDIKALIWDMFAAGSDTSYIVLEWALAELVRNPPLMKKLQDEVRGAVTSVGEETVREEDLSKMSYLKAVIKEALRLHPPSPLLIPRESVENCVVEGYDIPKKTRVMINVWAIGRDPKFWEATDEFRPERFIDSPVDFRGNDFQFIPFGAGRRICPGMNFGLSTVEVALANLVHRFDWEPPVGTENANLNMDEALGALARKKQRLHLVAKLHAAL